jgi:hypothetical protein
MHSIADIIAISARHRGPAAARRLAPLAADSREIRELDPGWNGEASLEPAQSPGAAEG